MTILNSLLALLLTITSANSYATAELRFIGDQNFVTGDKFQETEIGGLSGIFYDRKTKKLLAISDDKSKINETRFYEFDMIINEKSFQVKTSSVVKLKDQDGNFFKLGKADFEGISLFNNDILASSEGPYSALLPATPEFYRFSRSGEFIERLPIPDKFLPPKKNQAESLSGSRDNKSFETLSTSIDGRTVYLGSEEALFQDGGTTTNSYASTVRIVLYKDLKPFKELAYNLEKIEDIKAVDLSAPDTGLVDIAAIDDKTFYALERSYIPSVNKNIIRIYKCTISDLTTDISKIDSLKNANYTSVKKELIADLDSFLVKMTPQKLDNVEGITLGPILANGNPSLIIVSDNNFGKAQRTMFVAFEILSTND